MEAPLTADEFRALALALPETEERSHMDHPDFRVAGKIFASLGPEEDWAMVKLTPEQQAAWVRKHPAFFLPFPGAWGKRGCTKVTLGAATEAPLRNALLQAWCNTAPKRLTEE